MEHDLKHIIAEIEALAAETGILPNSVVRAATGNPRLYERMKRRAEMLDRDNAAILRYIADRRAQLGS
jgi:hypothetical protein